MHWIVIFTLLTTVYLLLVFNINSKGLCFVQVDQFESEVEQMYAGSKKKKLDKDVSSVYSVYL